jgi:ubiquinone biosynthesis protein COQ9
MSNIKSIVDPQNELQLLRKERDAARDSLAKTKKLLDALERFLPKVEYAGDSLLEQYAKLSISDPAEASAFYWNHRAELIKFANKPSNVI